METLKELLSLGREALKASAKVGGQEFLQFEKLYQERVGNTISLTCDGCFDSAFDYMENIFNRFGQAEKVKAIDANRKFILKTGGSVYFMHRTLTNHNITDNDALIMLAHNPNNIGSFQNPPKDWEQMVVDFVAAKPEKKVTGSEEKKEVKSSEKVLTKNEMKAILKELGVSESEYQNLNVAGLTALIAEKKKV